MEKTWFLWPYHQYSGKDNMAIDLFLAKNISTYLDRPLIRFYGWNPEAISLGFSQKQDDINSEKAIADGIDIVRRPTGGRAIFHSRELTYSIVFPSKDMKREELYYKVNLWFHKLLNSYNVESTLQPEQPDFREYYRKGNSSACFSAAARYELKVDKRKILGSAQRIFSDAILQHGSFMLGSEHLNLFDYLKISREKKDSYLATFEAGSTDLSKYIDTKKDAREVADDFCRILELEGIKLVDFKEITAIIGEIKKYYREIEFMKMEAN